MVKIRFILLLIFALVNTGLSYSKHKPSRHSGPIRKKYTETRNENMCKSKSTPPNPTSGCCGIDTSITDNIIGGTKTALRQYPWLTLVEYKIKLDNSYETKCGGSLISGRYVLTASHCVTGTILEEAEPVSVRLGEYDKSNNIHQKDCTYSHGGRRDCVDHAVRIPIDTTIAHKDYNQTINANDIALIRLRKLVYFTDHIRPICLPTVDFTEKRPTRVTLYAAGWGVKLQRFFDTGRDDIFSDVKRRVALSYKPLDECKKHWRKVVDDTKICAGGDGGRGTCMGDSGGPLMYENTRSGFYEVVGVVSFGSGDGCAKKGIADVYSKVYSYDKWIRDNIEP